MNLPAASENESDVLAFPTSSCSNGNFRIIFLVAITVLWAVIYVAGMFTPALLDDVDTVHAEAAREMLLRHDWVTLHINGIRYLEKAPLLYWQIAASYKLFGVSDWSTRLPLVLGILFWLLALYALGRYAYGERGGFYSAVVLATALGPYLFTRFLIPDALVGLWLTLSFYFFLRSLDEATPSRFTCWGLAAACALNVLTKGLIGLVFPAGVIGLYLLLTGNLRHLWRLRLVSSTVVLLVIAAPWHILAAIRNPDQGATRGFLWFYFVNEQFLRYLNKRVPPGYDTVPLLIFWGLLILWLVPWACFFRRPLAEDSVALASIAKSAGARRQRANLLFALWVLVIVIFFSFSTRQEYYTIPALPGMALLVGGWLERESNSGLASPERGAGRISSAVLFAMGAAAFFVGGFLLDVNVAGCGNRSSRLAEKESSRLRSLLRTLPRSHATSHGSVSRPVAGIFTRLFSWHGTELDFPQAKDARARQFGVSVDDGSAISVRSFRICDLFSDSFFPAARAGNPKAFPSGRCRGRGWRV